MKHWLLPTFAIVLSACTAARPVIYSDPSFNPATVKRQALIELLQTVAQRLDEIVIDNK